MKFKNAKKKTVIAGQTTGSAAGQKLLRRGIRTVCRLLSVIRLLCLCHMTFIGASPSKRSGPREDVLCKGNGFEWS